MAGEAVAKDDPPDSGHNADEPEAGLPQLKPVVTKGEKHDEAKPDGPEVADDFGLPVRKPRRRTYDLDELESPVAVKSGMEGKDETKEDDSGGMSKTKEEGLEPKKEAEEAPVLAKGEEAKANGDPGPAQKESTAPRESVEEPKSPVSSKSISSPTSPSHRKNKSLGTTSEFSHQAMHMQPEEEAEQDDGEWQDMPALAEHRHYDDWGKVIVKSYDEVESEAYGYNNLGGAGKGYTRVQLDEDAQSATSMDENTAYLFKDQYARNALDEDDEEGRDIASQMNTTKELLTEGQRIAYVGVVRLSINTMAQEMDRLDKSKGTKKMVELAAEALRMWSQKVMVRLYAHMEIDQAEQVMVEQLADHGVLPEDLTPALMINARVKNPKAEEGLESGRASVASPRPSSSLHNSTSNLPRVPTPAPPAADAKVVEEKLNNSTANLSKPSTPAPPEVDVPPAYSETAAEDIHLQDSSELKGKDIDLDLRWTVLCDLFLLLIASSSYDARSRVLLERVGSALSMDWQEICRFEKRVTDALEMQEQAEKENWNEEDHLKAREKRARNKRLVVMGLCTVGGGLIIGLSAGALAPVIGAGLAAGFTGIGVAGTGTFLGGTGAAALIGTTGTLIGGNIGLKGAMRRTGAVKTFEYKPLFNNKRVNLIVTVAGWMTGNVDDVRLPFSTVDPVMGDIYSVNWEPEMLQSMGQTIQILGTEALTQTIQQILGATFLATLMAGLSLPIVLTKLAYLIDNPWTVSLARADACGLILADSLIERNLGERPITLVGFSLGSRVIFSCLRELARRGALGLVQNVYMFGSPVVVKKDEWTRARTIVAGRFVNGYASNDWILAYLFRATSGGVLRIAGLATVDVPGIENINCTEEVPGHMAYRGMIPTLLHNVGWLVDSVEFTEIEDPDPDNHEKRQRELLHEIEEARSKLEAAPEKKGFRALFSRNKKQGERKAWETYDERSAKVVNGDDPAESEKVAKENAEVMFDVEAIRREALQLAVEGVDVKEIKSHMQIKEIPSTLPALKIESPKHLPATNGSTGSLQRAVTYGSAGAVGAAAINGARSSHGSRPGSSAGKHDYEEDDGVTMSFEDSPNKARPHLNGNGMSFFTYPSHGGSTYSSDHDLPQMLPPPDKEARPPLRSASTTPVHAASSQQQQQPSNFGGHNHNPWADEEDEFGQREGRDGEVEMSFE